MEGKLIKVDNEYKLFQISEPDGTLISVSGELSIKNCEAIANGYDLDELACKEIGIDISVVKHIDRKVIENNSVSTPIHEAGALGAGLYHQVKGFEIGFQKALEILSDKKFSEFLDKEKELGISDIKTIERIQWYYNTYFDKSHQTEWDVEIETIEYGLGNDENGRPVFETRNLLDADGCLILKRC